MRNEETKRLVLEHLKKYPLLAVQDIFKYVYQSAFGCEHMVASEERAIDYIKREYEERREFSLGTDKLDGGYSRVHLSCLDTGISPETLARLFCLSAKKEEDGEAAFFSKLRCVKELIGEGELPFSAAEYENELEKWRDAGYPAVHHSEAFRAAYKPSYRVISDEFVQFLPLFSAIDKALGESRVTLAIEGGSASGKSTLAEMLSKIYDCTVFHVDDFFLRPEQRTAERLAEVGGNFDRERFLSEVLLPISAGKTVKYRKFDCGAQMLGGFESVEPKKLTVIEGVYSMHPELEEYYDSSVFLDITAECQKERILKRNSPTFAARFFDEWIPMEKRYFEATGAKARCTLTFDIKTN